MEHLEKFYKSVGSDVQEVVARLGGAAALVERFLTKFKSDESFNKLHDALENGAVKDAFREAHTLKGLCANLSLQNLFEQARDITELLREENLEAAKQSFPALEREYIHVLDAMKEFHIGE